jgi:hypothetical protein
MFKMFPQKIKKSKKKKIAKEKNWIFKNILRVENKKIDELSSSQKLFSKMFKRFKKKLKKRLLKEKVKNK